MPSNPIPPATITPAERCASVDALRGLVITLMIFVNDIADAVRAPLWLKHVKATEDAMTLPDIVFPSFLFIAGISIPLAFGKALSSGQGGGQLAGKILSRTLALLVMGVFMVNMESASPWPRGLWGVLAYVAMAATFAVEPRSPGLAQKAFRAARYFGYVALAALALLFVDGEGHHLIFGPLFDPKDTVWFRHEWWGILGLIGWAYLTASLLYLALRRRREWLVGAFFVLMLFYVSSRTGTLERYATREWLAGFQWLLKPLLGSIGAVGSHVSIGEGLGSLAAITMAGCCLGSILAPDSDIRTPGDRLRWAGLFTGLLLAAALVFDSVYGINKIQATPTWCFLCAAIASGAWMLLYWLMDLRGVVTWSALVRPAGANPLLAYVLHPFLYLLATLVGLNLGFYKDPGMPVMVSILGSLLMSLLVGQLTGLIARAGYRIKV